MEECLSSEEDIETSEVEIVSVVHPVQNHTEKSLEEKVPCPICFESFTPQFLEIHASMCGERDQHVPLDEKTDMGHNNGKAMERRFKSVDESTQEPSEKNFSQDSGRDFDQVESATEHSMIGLSDEILNCGYTGNVSIPNKDTIVRSMQSLS
ncbi:hypothetical protein CgunFtcFv8_024864 [Champsocephalus gunnari]|uniref:UBZ4-type domain-containing protein n=1 Tax=Champsocephalus gunnari TaxID=52237 RepID=A0AAN8DFA4_CHAGU|nr:hypothetical protein CgunFtcFv8_024864 [Champsocephalus gunnari]